MIVLHPASGPPPPMRQLTRRAQANCWPPAGSTEPRKALLVGRIRFEKPYQSRVDLLSPLLLNPVAGALDNQPLR
jgi:hypothetical protein